MQICPVCGQQLPDETTECPVCGCPLNQPPPPPVMDDNGTAGSSTPPPTPPLPPIPPTPPTPPTPPAPEEPEEPEFEEPRRRVWPLLVVTFVIVGLVVAMIVWGVVSRPSSPNYDNEIDSLLNSGYDDTEEVITADSAAEPDFNYYEAPGEDYSTDGYDMPYDSAVADSVISDWEYGA
ncbi:MAG: zinc-ribbon domain-containing protein [Alloprevotella sp.]